MSDNVGVEEIKERNKQMIGEVLDGLSGEDREEARQAPGNL